MSTLEGDFKGKVKDIFTSEEGKAPKITFMFILTHEKVEGGDYRELEEDLQQPAYYTYWMDKNVKDGWDESSYSRSVEYFKKAWGFEINTHQSIEALLDAVKDEEKLLVLVADDYKSHKIKYINTVGERKSREGTVDLQSIL